jgi:hypothetical protein
MPLPPRNPNPPRPTSPSRSLLPRRPPNRLTTRRNQTSPLKPFIKPEALNRVPDATGIIYDAVLERANPIRLSFSPDRRFSGRRPGSR